ncbi:hypothetical protein TNCV_2839991 [Trichonephila clavipes]|uniref:Uncharacterized protein n=1 Tax=Trichonephila clavipes TaxID=2585209 RepID=A0A8X6V8Y7_TRICX|nr:hypothetical protein TNCV_2839991 [Trichonephila clavipes]
MELPFNRQQGKLSFLPVPNVLLRKRLMVNSIQGEKFQKIWWNNHKIFPRGQDVKQLPIFVRLLWSGLSPLTSSSNSNHQLLQASFCTLCDVWEDMDADHIRRCPALKGFSLCELNCQARGLLVS